jgi:Tfp pilus assembly protein PilP
MGGYRPNGVMQARPRAVRIAAMAARGHASGPRGRAWTALALAAVAFTFYGCGESKEQKAEKKVCSARSDIKSRVTALQALTPTAASASQIKTEVNAIVEDLKTIRGAIPELTPGRKEEITKATEQFSKQASEAVGSLKSAGSISSVETELRAALKGLGQAYETALAPIRCSS